VAIHRISQHLFALLEPGPGLCDLLQSCDIDLGIVRGCIR